MQLGEDYGSQKIARIVGWALLVSIAFGVLGAMFVADGIDVNMSADITATAENMLEAEMRLRAKAYLGLLGFALQALISVGLYLLLHKSGRLLAGWFLFVSFAAAVLTLLGTVFTMNAAHIAGNEAFIALTDKSGRLTLTALQVVSDYTSFHLSLVLSSAAMGGFFYLFLKSGLMPKLIAGWGVFASLFVAVTIVARDFIPALGHIGITASFMLCNLLAMIAAGLYLSIKGVQIKE